METDVVALWVLNFAVWLDRDFLSEDAEQGMLAVRNILSEDGFPQTLFGLEYILQTGILQLVLSRGRAHGRYH